MKRKMLALALSCLLLLSAAGCAENVKKTVTATFYPLYVALINVTRDVEGVSVHCMAPPQAGCLHDYQMTTADRRLLEDSDVVVINGAGLEGFLDALLPNLEADVIDTSKGIALLEDEEHGVNAHIWVSVQGMIRQVENIVSGLAAADPDHAEQYRANGAAYTQRLEALYEEMKEALTPCEGMPIVTFHEAFDYFAEAFGLRVVAVVQSDHNTAPSGRELAALAEAIRAEHVRALFAEPQYEDVSVDILSRETGVPVYLLDPAVSGEAEPEDYDAYIRIMRRNAEALKEALE